MSFEVGLSRRYQSTSSLSTWDRVFPSVRDARSKRVHLAEAMRNRWIGVCPVGGLPTSRTVCDAPAMGQLAVATWANLRMS